MAERQDLEDLRSKNAEMLESISQLEKQVHLLEEECKAKDDREQNLRAVLATFTNSSRLMDRMVDDQRPSGSRTGLGYSSSSCQNVLLTRPTDPSTSGGLSSVFVQGQTKNLEPVINATVGPKGMGYKSRGGDE